MRVYIIQISIFLLTMISMFYNYSFSVDTTTMTIYSITGILLTTLTVVCMFLNILSYSNNNNMFGIFNVGFIKRVYSRYGVFYLNYSELGTIRLLKDHFIYYEIIHTIGTYSDINKLSEDIDNFLDEMYKKKFSETCFKIKTDLKKWDGYTNTISRRDEKIKKIVN